MSRTTLYTAVGHLALKCKRGGQPYPVVIVNQREHMIAPADLLLWSRLCWRIREREHLRRDYESAAHEVAGIDAQQMEQAFDDILNQLINRGLIATGEGDTQVEALYDLMSDLYVSPLEAGFGSRLAAATKLLAAQKATGNAKESFKPEERSTKEERRILRLAHQALLSTAELIKCEESGVQDVSNSEKLLGAIYYDDETTCYNIAQLMRKSPKRDSVVLAVCNLFLHKQIVFQRVCL